MELSLSQIELTLCRKLFALICSESSTQKAIYLHPLAITVQLSPHFSLIKQYKQIWVFLKPVSPELLASISIPAQFYLNWQKLDNNCQYLAQFELIVWQCFSVSSGGPVHTLFRFRRSISHVTSMCPELVCLFLHFGFNCLQLTSQVDIITVCVGACVFMFVCGLTCACVSLQQSVQSVNTAVSDSKTCYRVYVKVVYQRVLPLRNFLVRRK